MKNYIFKLPCAKISFAAQWAKHMTKCVRGPSINDVTHFLRFLTPPPPPPCNSILLNLGLWSNVTFWQKLGDVFYGRIFGLPLLQISQSQEFK